MARTSRRVAADEKYAYCCGINHPWDPESGRLRPPKREVIGRRFEQTCPRCGTVRVRNVNPRTGQWLTDWDYEHDADWKDRSPHMERSDWRAIALSQMGEMANLTVIRGGA